MNEDIPSSVHSAEINDGDVAADSDGKVVLVSLEYLAPVNFGTYISIFIMLVAYYCRLSSKHSAEVETTTGER